MKRIIEVKDLEYTYPDGTQALKGVSLEVFEGESVALIGPNGAGKSTLLLHLNGVLRAETGSVRVLGKELKRKNLKEIRGKVGMVFQDPDDQLFSLTVFDDVAFGPLNLGYPESRVRERVELALQEVELEGYEGRCPHHLSFGEKKRVSLATVLSMEPEILILDEPTSNLDPHARRSLMKLLQELPLTKVIASHDMEMVSEICERVVLLFEGQIVADGGAKQILTDMELLEVHGLEPPPLVRFLQQLGYEGRLFTTEGTPPLWGRTSKQELFESMKDRLSTM